MYKTQSTLGLIGSILGIIAIILIFVASLRIVILFNSDAKARQDAGIEVVNDGDVDATVGAGIGFFIVFPVLTIASVVLGFMGTFKLRKVDKKGGMLLIIAGALALITLFIGGFFGMRLWSFIPIPISALSSLVIGGFLGIVTIVLYLIGGIVAVAKKDAAPSVQV